MKEPRFWSANLDSRSREAAPLTRALLTPLAWIYAAITSARISHTRPVDVDAQVICIGNLTVGGVGKSPVVAALRAHLENKTDARIATLSRGYRGTIKTPTKVNLAVHTARDVGDEPLMLASTGESWIGADRAHAGQEMSDDGIAVIVMDDGHQNPGLYKDFTFIVIDSKAGFGNGFVVPKGPLREPIARGLARADAVIWMGPDPVSPEVTQAGLPVLRAHIVPCRELPSQPYVAFAGLGRPEKVFDTLAAMNVDVRDAVPFPDHHAYSDRDMNYLRQLAKDNNATLITTEKDYARMTPAQRTDISTLPVQVQFADIPALDSLLEAVLKQNAT